MAATHEFTTTINIGSTRYSAGTRCSVSDIPPGNFDSLTRLGILVPLAPQADHAPPNLTPGPTPEAPAVDTPKPEAGDDPDATPAEIAAKKAATTKKK